MIKLIFFAFALDFGWVSLAQSQVWVDPFTGRNGTEVQESYRSSRDQKFYGNYLFTGDLKPFTGGPATGDPNRNLERSHRWESGGAGANSSGPVYNPYTIYWK